MNQKSWFLLINVWPESTYQDFTNEWQLLDKWISKLTLSFNHQRIKNNFKLSKKEKTFGWASNQNVVRRKHGIVVRRSCYDEKGWRSWFSERKREAVIMVDVEFRQTREGRDAKLMRRMRRKQLKGSHWWCHANSLLQPHHFQFSPISLHSLFLRIKLFKFLLLISLYCLRSC